MNAVLLAVVGWLLPGGAYLLLRRYLQFAVFAVLVSATFAIGIALHGGGYQWPRASDLTGLDGFTILIDKAGVLAKALAGSPFFFAQIGGGDRSFLDARLHEYGTTLLTLAGLLNLLAVADAFQLRKSEPQ
jgi:hypothetical protein